MDTSSTEASYKLILLPVKITPQKKKKCFGENITFYLTFKIYFQTGKRFCISILYLKHGKDTDVQSQQIPQEAIHALKIVPYLWVSNTVKPYKTVP